MTLNGWLQILLYFVADPRGDAAARPLHDAWCSRGERTWLDPVLRPSSGSSTD